MAEPRSDLVDDQRRRARRRLVGAAVLALAAAVIVPLFLESEPKPLGQDVQILIPAVEGSKFVNRFTAETDAASRKAPPAVLPEPALPAAEAKPAAAEVSTPAAKPADAAAANAGNPVAAPATSPALAAEMPSAAAKPKMEDRAPKAEAKAPAKPEATVSAKSADGGFVVQLGAYAEAKVATELLSKLKAARFPAYAETLDTSQGKLHRVRVGPYATREKADAARATLKDKGHSGIVTPLR